MKISEILKDKDGEYLKLSYLSKDGEENYQKFENIGQAMK